MSLKIREQSPYSIIIEKDGKKYSGFLTLSSQKRDVPGKIVEKSGISTWKIKGILEHDKKKYVYGPYFKGKFLADIINEIKISDVQMLAEVLSGMPDDYMRGGLHTYGIIFGKDSVLVLPGFITESYLRLSSTEKRLNDFDWINSSDPTNFDMSYSLAVLSYQAITGTKPFPYSSRSDLIQRMSDKKMIAPEIVKHGLKKDISDFLVSVLASAAGKKTDINNWNSLLKSWIKEGLYREIDEQERLLLERKKVRLETTINKGYRFKYFVSRYRTIIIVCILVFTAAVYGISLAVSKSLEVPYTINMSPDQVIADFFESYNNIDHIGMEGAVEKKAGKELITPAVNMNVIIKTQMAYGTNNPVVPASVMIERGLQPDQYGKSVWGVTGLSVEKIGELKYKAEYTRWFSISEDSEDKQIPRFIYEGIREEALITIEKESKKTKLFSSKRVEYYIITEMEITEKGRERYNP